MRYIRKFKTIKNLYKVTKRLYRVFHDERRLPIYRKLRYLRKLVCVDYKLCACFFLFVISMVTLPNKMLITSRHQQLLDAQHEHPQNLTFTIVGRIRRRNHIQQCFYSGMSINWNSKSRSNSPQSFNLNIFKSR